MFGLLLNISTPNLPAASTMAKPVDDLYAFIFWVSVVCFVAIVGSLVAFVFKYRRKTDNDPTPYIEGHTPTEVGISVGLFIIVMIMFYWGWSDYMKMRYAPTTSYEINIIGQQWSWSVQYANGRKLMNEVYVPKGRPVKLIMTSSDVLHSFYVPAFRMKRDVVPGMYSYLSFTASETGDYDIYCAEYCGTAHSNMLGKIHILEPSEFEDWMDGLGKYAKTAVGTAEAAAPAGKSLVDMGAELYTKIGCNACHSTDGSARVGPSFKALFGHQAELIDGTRVTVDENYLRESIMDPTKKLVKGFAPAMPTYRGQLSDEQVNALVAYIKSL